MPKKISVKKKIVPVRNRTHQDIADRIVSNLDLLPDYTELLEADKRAEMFRAYVEHQLTDEGKAAMADFDESWERGSKAIHAALPEHLQQLAIDLENDRATKNWIDEEIVYALGVAVGRRLVGAR
jgi:hypothetical protein